MPDTVWKYLLFCLLLSMFGGATAEGSKHQNQDPESRPVEPARVFVPRKDITVRNVQDVHNILEAELKAAQQRAGQNRPGH
jgi:hypothetical protein